MKVLVTGASGFLGRNLVRSLVDRGVSVAAIHRRPIPPPIQASALTWHRQDMADAGSWAELLDGVSTVYHLAWSSLPQSANEAPTEDVVENIAGSVRLLEAVRQIPACRVVFASSGGTVYGAVPAGRASEDDEKRPLTAYGVSKLAVESYLAHFRLLSDLDYAALRLANPFGPDQEHGRNFGVVATFVARALKDQTCLVFGDGQIERDFIYVDDAIEALLAAGERRLPRQVYNIGSGVGRSVNQVVAAIEGLLGRALNVAYVPARAFDAPRSVLDPSRAAQDFGWTARTSFETGLGRVLVAHRDALERS